MPAPKTIADIATSISGGTPELVPPAAPPADVIPLKPKMVKVRYLRGIWIDNPAKGKPGEADTVKIPRGTVSEMELEAAFDAVENGLVERWKPGATGISMAVPQPPPKISASSLKSVGGTELNAWSDD